MFTLLWLIVYLCGAELFFIQKKTLFLCISNTSHVKFCLIRSTTCIFDIKTRMNQLPKVFISFKLSIYALKKKKKKTTRYTKAQFSESPKWKDWLFLKYYVAFCPLILEQLNEDNLDSILKYYATDSLSQVYNRFDIWWRLGDSRKERILNHVCLYLTALRHFNSCPSFILVKLSPNQKIYLCEELCTVKK